MPTTNIEGQPYRILIIEDEPAQLHLLSGCLRPDYAISVAKTKKLGLEILAGGNIDILLLDITLPDGNGFEICHEVRSNKRLYGDIAIIFMTGHNSMDDEVHGLKLGANDYLRKPFNYAVLRARVALQVQLLRKTQLLAKLADLDGLTEIPNRRAFDQRLHNEWNRAKRAQRPLSLAVIDIDYFKEFNDNYGHSAGDECLKKLATSLRQVICRSSDFYARYGGEEFVVLLYDADLNDAKNIIQRLLQSFVENNIPHEHSKVADHVTFTAGLCVANPATEQLDDFFNCADTYLYQGKARGRNQICSGPLQNLSQD